MARDMTKGNIPAHMVLFAVPLVLGNLFQLLYNAVDSVLVGRFAGEKALAAVGCAGPVMNLIVLGVSGVCIGASVLMSQFYGAGKKEKLKEELSTLLLLGCAFSLVVVVGGQILARPLLKALQVPAEILDGALVYLRIVFVGVPFTFFYNALASALRSVGDSKTPVWCLAVASVVNGLLDAVFVAGLGLGVVGAAAATNIAQGLSVLLCWNHIRRHVPLLSLQAGELHMDKELLALTLKHGSVTALQQSCQPIGKLLIQSQINLLGVGAIAAFNAVTRMDDLACIPTQSISSAIMTFIAQNRGAGQRSRVGKGFLSGLGTAVCYWVCICTVTLALRRPIMGLFASAEDAEMLSIGVSYLGLMGLFYIFPAFTNSFQGFFRGMGNMTITLWGTITQISFRVLFVYLLVPRIGLDGVAWASAIGWSFMLLLEIPYFFYYKKKHSFFAEKQ